MPLISKNRTPEAIKFNNFEQLVGWQAKFNVQEFVRDAGGPTDPTRVEELDRLFLSIVLTRGNETISLKTTIKLPSTEK